MKVRNIKTSACCILAATCAAVAAQSAFAQTNVQLYGRLDTSIDLMDNGANSRTAVSSNSSRWGLRGTEDLGGGMRALFNLESGFSSDSGASNGAFDRRSVVGISGGFGQVVLGREYTPFYTLITRHFDPFGNAGAGASGDVLPFRSRESNSVMYSLPKLSGFSGSLMYTADETDTGPAVNRAVGAGFDWSGNGFGLGLGYHDRKASATADRRDLLLAGSYKFSGWQIGAQYSRYEASDDSFDQRSWGLSARTKLGSGEVLLSYIDLDDKRVQDGGARKLSIGYYYALSKRTTVYTVLAYIDNDGRGKFAVGPDKQVVAAGDSARNLQIGIRHNF
ncbi:MAG: porin [Burkholderiales bacterium]|nr:porin [Burkholderiales bacterium]